MEKKLVEINQKLKEVVGDDKKEKEVSHIEKKEAPTKEKEIVTPNSLSSKMFGEDKEWSALIDSFFWYLAVCLLLVPQLVGLMINGWVIFGILLTLLWTVYGGWIKRAGEMKAKEYLRKYENEKKLKDVATNKINRYESLIDGLKEQVLILKQRLADGSVIESKLIKNIEDLTNIVTKNVTQEGLPK